MSSRAPVPAERFMAIAMAELPPGWTYSFRKSLSGCCYTHEKRISAPKPVSREALYIWLHECAHAHENHVGQCLLQEVRAEQWAHATMRKHGIAVSKSIIKAAKRNVGSAIVRALVHGEKHIAPEALAFAGMSKNLADC
jgi:hypothetical protein